MSVITSLFMKPSLVLSSTKTDAPYLVKISSIKMMKSDNDVIILVYIGIFGILILIMFGSVPLIQSVVLFVINLFNHNPHRGYISYNSDNEINNLDMNYH